MNTVPTVLLIGGIDVHLERVKDQGARVVLVQHPDKLTPYQSSHADVLLVVDYTDWDTLLPFAEAARAVYGVDVVFSLTEGGLTPAGRLSDLWGLGDGRRHEASRRLRDKWLMRRHLAAHGLPGTEAAPVTDRESLTVFGALAGYPFVVKPTGTTAGFGLCRADGPHDLDRVWEHVTRLLGGRTDRGSTLFTVDGFLMEAYVDGPEFSVEAFSFAGRHVVVAVTEKLTDDAHFAELGHALPARLSPADRAELVAAVDRFLTVMDVADGPSHTEIRLGSRGPVVIESHNRVGGGHLAELVRAAYGIDLNAYAAAWALGRAEELPGEPVATGAACNRYVVRDPGTVTAVDGVAEVAAADDVLIAQVSVHPGDTVRPLRDNWDRIGCVVVRAADTDAAVRRCEELTRHTLRIETAPEHARPLAAAMR
ncbi:ATP-grasp domain-containing protein [Streptomyces boluensis]|uniref:ATP-grasp domain-containing protein n=1 Tax=Streptomyces boluensis TaxID=1775135 RepID=A0A964XJR7_9ACTN|nr:ATP-grasp domain-containing protein [Streptomyces boluensis]NBE49972.1 ATP-grasp domain-containing protein [Streptomyces boluensis]